MASTKKIAKINRNGVYDTYFHPIANPEHKNSLKNKEIDKKANVYEWDKTNFLPLSGMIGEVVEEINHSQTKRLIYVIKIEGTNYVPVDARDVEFFDKSKDLKLEKDSATVELKSWKEKLDLGLISNEEYDEYKKRLGPFVMGSVTEKVLYDNWLKKAKEELDIEYSNIKQIRAENKESRKREILQNETAEQYSSRMNASLKAQGKTNQKKVVAKKINKANVFSEKLLVNFMKGIRPNNYELIFDSYYVFLKNKFGQNKEVDDIIEEAARRQLRNGEAKFFYNEYINRKIKENSNYDKQIDSEIRQKVLHPKKKTKKVSSVNRSGLPKSSFYNNFWSWVVYIIIFIWFGWKIGVFENNKTKEEVKKSVKKYKSCGQCSKDYLPGQGYTGINGIFGHHGEYWCSKSCHKIWIEDWMKKNYRKNY
jgi:hypothetical protein